MKHKLSTGLNRRKERMALKSKFQAAGKKCSVVTDEAGLYLLSARKHWQYCFKHLVRPQRQPLSPLQGGIVNASKILVSLTKTVADIAAVAPLFVPKTFSLSMDDATGE